MKCNCRPAWIEVDMNSILHNIKEIKKYIGKQREIIGVIKDDGYGHGAVEVAKQIVSAGVKFLAVATVDEGIELREHQIEVPVLVLGYTGKSQIKDAVDHNLSITLYLEEIAREISKYVQEKGLTAKVHIKINTGMNRIGILPKDTIDFIKFIQLLKGIKIEGIFTHFASAEQKDKTDANYQFEIFDNLVNEIKKVIKEPIVVHAANSGATMDMPYAHFYAVRPGRLIYGLYPYPEVEKTLQLKTALSVRAEIIHINKIQVGEGVGYEGVFRPKQDVFVATLPLGWTDGVVSRRTVNKISVIVAGKKRKVVAVCADMCMIELGSSLNDISIGDIVTLIGEQDNIEITIDEIATPSEQTLGGVLSHLNRRLPRIYLKNKKPYLLKNPFEKYIGLN